MKCLGLFYLHYKTEFAPQKTIIAPYVYKKSTIFAIEIKTEQCGGTETCHLHSRYFFIRNLSLVLSRIDI